MQLNAFCGLVSKLDCYWVGSLDFNFSVEFFWGFPLNPPKVKLFAEGSTATKERADQLSVPYLFCGSWANNCRAQHIRVSSALNSCLMGRAFLSDRRTGGNDAARKGPLPLRLPHQPRQFHCSWHMFLFFFSFLVLSILLGVCKKQSFALPYQE